MRISINYRTGGTTKDSMTGLDTYKSETVIEDFESPEELIKKYQPTILSEGLMNAINELFNNERDHVVFNFGKGNAQFNAVDKKKTRS